MSTTPTAPPPVPAAGRTDPGPLPDAARHEPPQPGGDGNEDPGSERDVTADDAPDGAG